jgi:PAS domain S-box-containing protein
LSRLTISLAIALLAVEGALALWVVAEGPDDGGGSGWLGVALAFSVGVAFVVSGLVSLDRRPQNRTGVYLLGVGYLWFLGALTDSSNDWLFTIGFALANLVWVPFTALVLAYPGGELRTPLERALPRVVGVLLVSSQVLVLLFDPSPAPERCEDCGGSAIVVSDRPGLADLANAIWTVVAIGLIGTVVTLLVRNWQRATPARRRVLRPVLWTGSAALVAVATLAVGELVAPGAGDVLQVVFLLALAALPVAFLLGVLHTRLTRSPVNELVLALQQGTPIREALAVGLGDPTVEVAYRLAGSARWVDATGRRVDDPVPSPGRAVTTVEVHGLPIAAIVHDASLDAVDDVVESVAAAAGLALQNERLQAEARSQFQFLRQMTDTAPSLILNIDTTGRIRNQNRAAVAAAGVDDQELVRGQYFWDVYIDPEERQEVIARFEALAPSFEAGEYENTFTNARGERLVISWRSAPVVDTDGTVMSIVAGGIDITERHRLEEEKEREREFLNAIANEAPSLLCLVDEHGVVAGGASNKAFERTLEYEPDETGGDVFWARYVAPEDADDAARRILSVAAGDDMPATDSTWLTKSGRRITVSWSCTRLPDIDDRRLLLVSGVDVTERRQRELDIQRERDATTTVLQAIPGVIVVLDRTGVIRDRDVDNAQAAVNVSFRRTFGWSDTELVGRHFLGLLVTDDPEGEAARAIETAVAGRTSGEVESDWRTRDGRRVRVSWTATPVVDVTGRSDGLVLLSGIDVSERKARELEDERRRHFIDAITATIPSYLVVVLPDATVRADGVNEAFEQAFGWSADEIAGRSFVGCVTPESDFPARMLIANAANGVPQGEIESRWEARDGQSRIVAWTARPVTSPRGEAIVLVTGNDVTVRRLQEEELRASRQRLVAAGDEARRKLERNLHDGAQQRLVAMSVSLRLAETKLATDPEAVRPIIATAREELALALEELRELARGIHPAVLTDRGLVAAVEGLVGRTPLPVRAEVWPERLDPAVEAAAYYVIAESLTNVVKYAQASVAEVRVTIEDGMLVTSVSDDGVGGADPTAGSGLRGLADRVAALDGALTVESEPGAGTTVRATLPVRASDRQT